MGIKIEYYTVLRTGHIHNPKIVKISGWIAILEFLQRRNEWCEFIINLKMERKNEFI